MEGIDIDPDTAISRWCGERLDYDMAVEGLLCQQEQARQDVSAETSEPRAVGNAAKQASEGIRASMVGGTLRALPGGNSLRQVTLQTVA